jgi:hypothetical protein
MPHFVIDRYIVTHFLSFFNILLSLLVIMAKKRKVLFSYSTCKFWYLPMGVSPALRATELICLPLRRLLRLCPSFFPERGWSLFSGGAPDASTGSGTAGGTRRVFRQFSWLQAESGKGTLSHPTPSG